jgi:Na+-translocating ferredoxin:NAD+ oxidoreductase RnfD subunit
LLEFISLTGFQHFQISTFSNSQINMKFFSAILLNILLGFAAGLYLPWWSIALVTFVVALAIQLRPGKAFLAGFTGIFLCWALLAAWIDVQNNSILSQRMAQLFMLGSAHWLLVPVTGFIGGLVGGMAALTGCFLWKPAKQPEMVNQEPVSAN